MKKSKAPSRGTLARWWYSFRGKIPPQYRRDFQDYKIETNLNRTLLLSVFIIFIQVFLNILNIVMPYNDGGEIDLMDFIYMSFFTLAIGILYLVISLITKRGKIKSRAFKKALPYTLLYIYCAIQMVFLSFNVDSDAGMNSYIIALLIMGFFLIMRPIQCVISIIVLFVVALAIMALGEPGGDALSAILAADTWANLLIITFLVAAMSNVTYEMYMSNFLNRKRLEISNKRLNDLATTDSLTGLLNRWGFFEQVDTQWTGHCTHPGILAVYIFDIDHFKEYNDQYGHPAGDECLRLVAASMTSIFTDEYESLVCRYGGEEFVVVARVSSPDQARELAAMMREDIRRQSIGLPSNAHKKPVTISGGMVTVLDRGAATRNEYIALESLINKADKALYEAKGSGRDRLIVAAN